MWNHSARSFVLLLEPFPMLTGAPSSESTREKKTTITGESRSASSVISLAHLTDSTAYRRNTSDFPDELHSFEASR